jgi:hypothetical protein
MSFERIIKLIVFSNIDDIGYYDIVIQYEDLFGAISVGFCTASIGIGCGSGYGDA